MTNQRYTLLHLSEVFGETKSALRRRIAKLHLKAVNRDTRDYPTQALEYDYDSYLALARDYGIASSYTTDYEDIELTAENILDLCLERYPSLLVKEIELEEEEEGFVYTLEAFDGEKNYEIEIDPVSGALIKIEEEISPETYWEITREQINQVETIIDKILAEAKESNRLHEWELENEDGLVELSLELITEDEEKRKYKYNFASKEITEE